MDESEKTAKLFYTAKNELYTYEGKYFKNTCIAIAVMVVIIIIFGVVYERFLRKRFGKTHAADSNVELTS